MSTNVSREIRIEHYSQWLQSFDWTYFATMTTKYELTLKSARRMAEGFYKSLQRAGNARMFWCAEPFDIKEGFHLHALIKNNEMLSLKNLADMYQVVSGNKGIEKEKWNRIQLRKYNPKWGAGHYCAKYITKNLSDWDIYGK